MKQIRIVLLLALLVFAAAALRHIATSARAASVPQAQLSPPPDLKASDGTT